MKMLSECGDKGYVITEDRLWEAQSEYSKYLSKEGYPYDNALMERYFNTLKNDFIYQHYYRTQEERYTAIEEFAYVQYNHVRPHSYNNYKTPFKTRYGVA